VRFEVLATLATLTAACGDATKSTTAYELRAPSSRLVKIEARRSELSAHDLGPVQCILQIEGAYDGLSLGQSACALPDQDGDGRGDFALGAFNPIANVPLLGLLPGIAAGAKGFLVVLRGDGGAIGQLRESDEHRGIGGQLVALGDLDGDGAHEWSIGAPDFSISSVVRASETSSSVRIVDGASKNERFRVRSGIGIVVGAVGDVDEDGVSDLGFGFSRPKLPSGRFEVRSGRTNALLQELEIDGGSVSTMTDVGDVNGDGTPDFALGCRDLDIDGDRRGAVLVYSGRTGERLATYRADTRFEHFGHALLSIRDLDADGVADLLVGSDNYSGARRSVGKVTCLSLGKGEQLFAIEGRLESSGFGYSLAEVEDLDGDGFADVAVSAWRAPDRADWAGRTTLFALRADGLKPICELSGSIVTSLGDLDGDGRREFAVLSPNWPSTESIRGRALIYSLR
jgi:hypothetical protein